MPYCAGCGESLGSEVAVCPKCGTLIPGAPSPVVPGIPAAGTGLSENVAGALCYGLGWISGLIFFLIDKRPSVRFHAAQSMVIFGGLHIIQLLFVRGVMSGGMTSRGMFVGTAWILDLVDLVTFIAWIVCMVKAYQGEHFKLPIVGDIAERIAA